MLIWRGSKISWEERETTQRDRERRRRCHFRSLMWLFSSRDFANEFSIITEASNNEMR